MSTHRAILIFLSALVAVACIASVKASPTKLVVDHQEHDHKNGHHQDTEDHLVLVLNETDSNNGTDLSSTGPKRHKWEAYVYGTISVAVVSLLSLAGVIVIPFIKRKVAYDGVMLTFMALAVGTMTSDALLHLVPETLGLDAHDDEGEGEAHPHQEDEHEIPYLGKMCALLATLYGLYVLELILHSVAKLMKKSKVAQQDLERAVVKLPIVDEKESKTLEAKWTAPQHSHGHSHGGVSTADDSSAGHTILGLKSVAFVIVLSDAMHNFTDGLAIGAAFSKSSAAGIGVSIAVICHELPHEIGNFAILLNTGMSLKKALLLNFFSAVTAFAGLFPGIVAGQQETLSRWIFAGVAAGFLYVALVHMLRELQSFGSLPWHLSFILQNLGMLVGFGVIFLLALYEHELEALT